MRSARTGPFARTVVPRGALVMTPISPISALLAQHADDELARGRLADDFHFAFDDDVGAVRRLAHAHQDPRRARTSARGW